MAHSQGAHVSLPQRDRKVAPEYLNCMEVYISNQCNMACPSCCVDLASDKPSEIVRLSWEELRGAIDTFMNQKEVPYGGEKYIVFAGGETFLDYPNLIKAAEYCQRFPLRPRLFMYTNGSFVKEKWVRDLTALNTMIIFSIDGYKEDNDKYRIYRKNDKSAWTTVTENIKDFPREGTGTNTTLRPGNLKNFVKALDHFTKMGFTSCDFWPDYFSEWNPESRQKLGAAMEEFGDYYVARTENDGKIPFHSPMLHHALINATSLKRMEAWWKDCFRLILGADGMFYDCEGVMHFRPEGENGPSTIGHACGKIDWGKRQDYMDRADEYLASLGAEKDWQHVCPRLYYKIGEVKGYDPTASNMHLHDVSQVFLKGLLKTAARLRNNPSFKEEYLDKLPVAANGKEFAASQT